MLLASVAIASVAPLDPCDRVWGPGCEIKLSERPPVLIELEKSIVAQRDAPLDAGAQAFYDQMQREDLQTPEPPSLKQRFTGTFGLTEGKQSPLRPEAFLAHSHWEGILSTGEPVSVMSGVSGALRPDLGVGEVFVRRCDEAGSPLESYLVTAPDTTGTLTITAVDGPTLTLSGEDGSRYTYDVSREDAKIQPAGRAAASLQRQADHHDAA